MHKRHQQNQNGRTDKQYQKWVEEVFGDGQAIPLLKNTIDLNKETNTEGTSMYEKKGQEDDIKSPIKEIGEIVESQSSKGAEEGLKNIMVLLEITQKVNKGKSPNKSMAQKLEVVKSTNNEATS